MNFNFIDKYSRQMLLVLLFSCGLLAFAEQGNSAQLIEPVTINDLGVSEQISTAAFNNVAQTVSPLSPEQAKEIRQLWNESQRMTTYKGAAPPEPINSSKIISLDNGTLPTLVRLSAGYVSVLAFYDSTGAIWPIRGYDIGNPSAVNIVWNEGSTEEEQAGESFGNTLLLQAQTLYKTTNLVVMLRGLNTPVIVELIPGQQQVDYRMDIQVPKRGPLAKNAVSSDATSPYNVPEYMVDLINNIPPPKSIQAHVLGGDAQAWIYKKRLLIRTPLEIISPAWSSKVNGANGHVHVYELPLTSTLVALNNGEVVKLKIEGI
ncbi:MAG: DotH/IcmK family type IV secretion protein [Pseudomonadota bacterium]|nr:DotH/IcmK family type IV secretion protein [Pseudomonadota bacterium]